jgi:predicted O-methyltransferase YrrM
MTNIQRINTIYRIIKKIIKKPASIFLILKDETEFEENLQKKYGITKLPTADINQFLSNGKESIDHYTFLDGSSMITDLALLKSIAKSIPSCEYLEIGTWRGESIMNVAENAAHCTSINLSPNDIIALGLDSKYAQLHGCLIINQSNIKTVHANSMDFDFASLNQKFDLIFIDGDHSYEGVKSDTSKVYDLLRDENSIIVWHDYGYNPEVTRHSVMAAILDGLPTEAHQYLYHVSNTICAIYTKRNINTEVQDSPVIPTKVFQINLQTRPFEVK